MLNKYTLGAALLAAAAVGPAALAGERDFNTAAGAVIGAAIGGNNGGRDGAIVGGLVGAAIGGSLATNERPYNRGGGYYETRVYTAPPPPVYYAPPPPVYYAPPPVYYTPRHYAPAPAVVVVEPARPYYRERDYGHRWEGRRDYHEERHGYYGYRR